MREPLFVILIAALFAVGCTNASSKTDRGTSPDTEAAKDPAEAKTDGKQQATSQGDTPKSGPAPTRQSPSRDAPDEAAPGTTTVVAEGVGTSADQALKDAFRNAVRQVVGAVVDAETLVKNDEIISDKVLTYSDGFVKTYKELSKKEEKGLFRTKIQAQVERRSVIAKLKEAKVTVKDVDGKGIFAEVVTQLEAEKNAAALVKKALEGFPPNVMEAEVVGKAEVVERNESKVKVKIRVRFSVNSKSFDTLSAKLQKALKAVAKKNMEFSSITSMDRRVFAEREMWRPTKTKDRLTVLLNTHTTKGYDRMEWLCYEVDKSVAAPLANCTRALTVKLSLLGNEDQVIALDRFAASDVPIWNGFVLSRVKSDNKAFSLFPFFCHHVDYGMLIEHYLDPTITADRKISLTLNELKAIQSIKCELIR